MRINEIDTNVQTCINTSLTWVINEMKTTFSFLPSTIIGRSFLQGCRSVIAYPKPSNLYRMARQLMGYSTSP